MVSTARSVIELFCILAPGLTYLEKNLKKDCQFLCHMLQQLTFMYRDRMAHGTDLILIDLIVILQKMEPEYTQ